MAELSAEELNKLSRQIAQLKLNIEAEETSHLKEVHKEELRLLQEQYNEELAQQRRFLKDTRDAYADALKEHKVSQGANEDQVRALRGQLDDMANQMHDLEHHKDAMQIRKQIAEDRTLGKKELAEIKDAIAENKRALAGQSILKKDVGEIARQLPGIKHAIKAGEGAKNIAKGAANKVDKFTAEYTPTLRKGVVGAGKAVKGGAKILGIGAAAGAAGVAGAAKPSSFADLIIVLGWVIHFLQISAGMTFSARLYIFFLVLIFGIFAAGDKSPGKWKDFLILMFAAFFDLAFYKIQAWLAAVAWMPLWVPTIFVKHFWPVWVYAGIIMALRPGAVTKKSKLTVFSIVLVLFFWVWYGLGASGAMELAETTFGFEPGEGVIAAEKSRAAQIWDQFTSGERDEVKRKVMDDLKLSNPSCYLVQWTSRCKEIIAKMEQDYVQRQITEEEASKAQALAKRLKEEEKIIGFVQYRDSTTENVNGMFILEKGEEVKDSMTLRPMAITKLRPNTNGTEKFPANEWSVGVYNGQSEVVDTQHTGMVSSQEPLLFGVNLKQQGFDRRNYERRMQLGVEIEDTTTTTIFPVVVGEKEFVDGLEAGKVLPKRTSERGIKTNEEYYRELFAYYKSISKIGDVLDEAYPLGSVKAVPQQRFVRIYLYRQIGEVQPIVKVGDEGAIVRLKVMPFRETEEAAFAGVEGEIVEIKSIKLELPDIFEPVAGKCDFNNGLADVRKLSLKDINEGFKSTGAGLNCDVRINKNSFVTDAKGRDIIKFYDIKATMVYDYLVKSSKFEVPEIDIPETTPQP